MTGDINGDNSPHSIVIAMTTSLIDSVNISELVLSVVGAKYLSLSTTSVTSAHLSLTL